MRTAVVARSARCLPGIALLLCSAVISASAQGGDVAPTVAHEEEVTHISFEGSTMDIAWTRDRGVSEHKLLIPADRAYAAFPTVFGELGIDPNIIFTKEMLFGNAGATYRHTIAKERLSHYFDCGQMLGVSTADTYEMWIRIIAQVVPADGGLSKVRVEVQANAKASDRPGGSVRCQSNGRLEQRMAKLLQEAAAGKTK
ncbi:MAG: hypothetical protein ABI884_00555 [Gemmatimonadota bacterium]